MAREAINTFDAESDLPSKPHPPHVYDGGWLKRDQSASGMIVSGLLATAFSATLLAFGLTPTGLAWDMCCLATFILALLFTLFAAVVYASVNAWHKDFMTSPSDVRKHVENGFRERSIAFERRKPESPEGFAVGNCVWALALPNTKVYVKAADFSTYTRVYVGPDDPQARALMDGIRKIIDETIDASHHIKS